MWITQLVWAGTQIFVALPWLRREAKCQAQSRHLTLRHLVLRWISSVCSSLQMLPFAFKLDSWRLQEDGEFPSPQKISEYEGRAPVAQTVITWDPARHLATAARQSKTINQNMMYTKRNSHFPKPIIHSIFITLIKCLQLKLFIIETWELTRLLVKSACFIPEALDKDLLHCIWES